MAQSIITENGSYEVGVELKNRDNSKFSKEIKLWSTFTGRTCVRLRAPWNIEICWYLGQDR